MDQQALIDAMTRALRDAPGLRALILRGSFGRGTADGESDVDFGALVATGDQAAFLARWRSALSALVPVVHWAQRPIPGGALVNTVSDGWLRIDLMVAEPMLFRGTAQNLCRPLIDPTGFHATLPGKLPPRQPDPATVARLTGEFIRVLGLLPVVIARREYVVAVDGVGMLRRMLIDLMLEEVPEPDRGGALHLGRLLSAESIAMLESLPYPNPEREQVIAAHLSLAEAFLPRARALNARLGLDWPEAFFAATQRRLGSMLGVAATS